jgi:hypothetical protein
MTAFDPIPSQTSEDPSSIHRPLSAPPPGPAAKRPILAALFSLFPGMGHVYNGLYLRGLVFFLLIASLMALIVRGHALMGFTLAFFWLFNILDAYRQAVLINYGYALDLGLTDLPRAPLTSQAGTVAGVLLVLIGLFSLADRYLDINLDWIFDLWPVGLILVGAWLIVGAFRDRRRTQGGPGGI